MAWNEPGGSKDNDPWGTRRKEQGPPDLDEVVRKLQEKLNKLFGRKGGSGGSGGGSGGGGAGAIGIGVIGIIALLIWLATGIYIIKAGERGVELRFGNYADTTMPGPHWHLPYPLESVEKVDVDQIRNAEIGYRSGGGNGRSQTGATAIPVEALMLTRDENIIDIRFAVQYRIKDAKDYLFQTRDPDLTLRQATETAIREIVGKSNMDYVLTEGRSDIVVRAAVLIQNILDRYKAGILITSVNMQDAQPPEEVQDAFDDAVKAREDEQRLKNEAEAYSNDVLPKARGAAARQLEEANAYKEQVIAKATGEASRFTQILVQYQKAPEVTRERIYLDALQEVLSKTSKVVVDTKAGNNLLMMPLDQLLKSRGLNPRTLDDSLSQLPHDGAPSVAGEKSDAPMQRDAMRGRERR